MGQHSYNRPSRSIYFPAFSQYTQACNFTESFSHTIISRHFILSYGITNSLQFRQSLHWSGLRLQDFCQGCSLILLCVTSTQPLGTGFSWSRPGALLLLLLLGLSDFLESKNLGEDFQSGTEDLSTLPPLFSLSTGFSPLWENSVAELNLLTLLSTLEFVEVFCVKILQDTDISSRSTWKYFYCSLHVWLNCEFCFVFFFFLCSAFSSNSIGCWVNFCISSSIISSEPRLQRKSNFVGGEKKENNRPGVWRKDKRNRHSRVFWLTNLYWERSIHEEN